MISTEPSCWAIERNSQIFNEEFYFPLFSMNVPLYSVRAIFTVTYPWTTRGKQKRFFTTAEMRPLIIDVFMAVIIAMMSLFR
jgi:hypothetical protein